MIKNKPNKIELSLFMIALVIAFSAIYFLGPSITGLIIKEFSYQDKLNLVVASSGNYTWIPQNAGALTSIKIDGRVTNHGKARVYIVNNGAKYLIFDSTRLNGTNISNTINSNNSITGFAVDNNGNDKGNSDNNDQDRQKNNKAPQWKGIDEFTINGTATINLSQYFTDKDGDALIYSASQVDGLKVSISNELVSITPTVSNNFNTTITFSASDGVNAASETVGLNVVIPNIISNITLVNATIPLNQTIAINLSYNSGTIYDANDNGEESVHGIVDMTVQGTKFNWNVDESRLCTRWEIYNVENSASATFCNGNSDCCAFLGLLPTRSNWSEIYYSAFGKDGAGYSNIVSAQVIYYDVNLSINNPKSEIYNSGWGNKSVAFYNEETGFSGKCLDTCSLTGLNKSSYTLLFEIEDNAVLKINKIEYSALVDVHDNYPVILKNFSAINISKSQNATINLSEYFYDSDGDALTYDYYKTDNITIYFDNNTAAIIPDKDFEGTRYTFITANDSSGSVSSNVFMVNIQTINITPSSSFIIQNSSGSSLAVFDSLGNLNIKGTFTQSILPNPGPKDFVLINASGNITLAINNPSGNMQIFGTLTQNSSSISSPSDSFVIQNSIGRTVAYIDSSGNLVLSGILTQNVLFR